MYSADVFIKRDDLTGFAFGGNKGRKLEYIIANALRAGASSIVTCGSRQSNFIRQLGVACAMAGIRCHAIVMDLPYETEPPSGIQLDPTTGNFLLGSIAGVNFHIFKNDNWEMLFEETENIAKELIEKGEIVCRVPIGGSSALGAYSFYEAGREISLQAEPFDWIVFASSSGSTQVGLATYFHGRQTKVLGIAVDPEPDIATDFEEISEKLNELNPELQVVHSSEFLMKFDFVGDGYGVTDEKTIEAIRDFVKLEGIFLDPIYTGKAWRGMEGLMKAGKIGGRVLFWHTGGLPTLFALRTVV